MMIWSWLSAALLAVLSAALTLYPRLLLFLSEGGTSLTPLEAFLALHFGIFLAAIAFTLVLNVPSPKPPVPFDEGAVPSHPLLLPLTIAANLSAFLAWNTRNVGALASIVFFTFIIVGLWGLWTIIFATSGSVSKSAGIDKHTSCFIQAAASSQETRLKRGE